MKAVNLGRGVAVIVVAVMVMIACVVLGFAGPAAARDGSSAMKKVEGANRDIQAGLALTQEAVKALQAGNWDKVFRMMHKGRPDGHISVWVSDTPIVRKKLLGEGGWRTDANDGTSNACCWTDGKGGHACAFWEFNTGWTLVNAMTQTRSVMLRAN